MGWRSAQVNYGPGEELRCAVKRGPSIRIETDTLTHPGVSPESVSELITWPVGQKEGVCQ